MSDEELIKKYVPVSKQKSALSRLKTGYPVQYIIGSVDFNGYIINVDERVLIPRFETELLCDKLRRYIISFFNNKISIADLGCGSGAISIYLQKHLKCPVTAFDISNEALELAKINILKNEANVNVIKHDILNKIPGKYDVIVSNPPYIKKDALVNEKTKFEPQNALFAEDNGLIFYKKILSYASSVLNKKNIIAFEIGEDEGKEIISLAKQAFPLAKINLEKDFNNKDRFIFIFNE